MFGWIAIDTCLLVFCARFARCERWSVSDDVLDFGKVLVYLTRKCWQTDKSEVEKEVSWQPFENFDRIRIFSVISNLGSEGCQLA